MDTPYPGYDPLSERDHWDERTRAVVVDRVEHPPPYRFFSEAEASVLNAVCDRIIPQDDRRPDERVPIAPFIDESLEMDETKGFRQPDVPWAQELWRRGLQGVEETSHARHGRGFTDLDPSAQDDVLSVLSDGGTDEGVWASLPANKFFSQLVQQVVTVYYAHPTAWAEIGWGGPANPRGYVRTGYGRRDPWEPVERREASSVELVNSREHRQEPPSGSGGATH